MTCCSESSDNPHYAIVQRVIELLRCLGFDCFREDEIYESEFPFLAAPPHGLAVSMLTERIGKGTSGGEDVGYGVMLTRIMRSLGQKGYMADRSAWRKKVLRHFHNKRICPAGTCEIITKVEPGQIDIPQKFANSGIDPSVMNIWVWVRTYDDPGVESGLSVGCSDC